MNNIIVIKAEYIHILLKVGQLKQLKSRSIKAVIKAEDIHILLKVGQ